MIGRSDRNVAGGARAGLVSVLCGRASHVWPRRSRQPGRHARHRGWQRPWPVQPRHHHGRAGTHFVTGNIYNGLLMLDEAFNPLPDLAESWSVSPDGTTYTFNLAHSVTWHDGQPFTSADVKFTFEEVLLKFHARTKAGLEIVLAGHRHAGRLHGGHALQSAVRAAAPAAGRGRGADPPEARLRGHRHPEQPGQQPADRDRPVQVRRVRQGRPRAAGAQRELLQARACRTWTSWSSGSSRRPPPRRWPSRPARSTT